MDKFKIRSASLNDVANIVSLLQDDILGKTRESDDLSLYKAGLKAILDDKLNYFFVAELDHEIVGCFQLTIIPSLSRGASTRALIESVRIKSSMRGKKLGLEMMKWAIDFCKGQNCSLVQLTTDKQRQQAHDFYKKLGFVASHIGMKLKI